MKSERSHTAHAKAHMHPLQTVAEMSRIKNLLRAHLVSWSTICAPPTPPPTRFHRGKFRMFRERRLDTGESRLTDVEKIERVACFTSPTC